jgi:hypothetical protein
MTLKFTEEERGARQMRLFSFYNHFSLQIFIAQKREFAVTTRGGTGCPAPPSQKRRNKRACSF